VESCDGYRGVVSHHSDARVPFAVGLEACGNVPYRT